jgi:hypothetical protein
MLFRRVTSCNCRDLAVSFAPEQPLMVSVKRNVLGAFLLCDMPKKLKVLSGLLIECLNYTLIKIKR